MILGNLPAPDKHVLTGGCQVGELGLKYLKHGKRKKRR